MEEFQIDRITKKQTKFTNELSDGIMFICDYITSKNNQIENNKEIKNDKEVENKELTFEERLMVATYKMDKGDKNVLM